MERQLVKQGRNALTMTLPSKWIKKNNLTQEDSVEVNEEKGNLIVKNKQSKIKKETTIDISNMRRGLAFHIITGLYIEGYDKIIIKHNNYKLSQEIASAFLAMIAESHNEEEIILKDIIEIPQDNFLEIFNRSCQILIRQARLLKKQIEKEIGFKEVKLEERLLDNNLFYCLRYINKYESVENSYKYFLLSTTIESIGDFVSEISKHIEEKKKIDKDVKENIELTIETIEKYVLYLFEGNVNKSYEVLKKFKTNLNKKTFIGGLCFAIGENLYNYIGYLVEKN